MIVKMLHYIDEDNMLNCYLDLQNVDEKYPLEDRI